jgi:hypothetical protein
VTLGFPFTRLVTTIAIRIPIRGNGFCLSSLGRRHAEIAVQIEAKHLVIDPGLQELPSDLGERADRFGQGWCAKKAIFIGVAIYGGALFEGERKR